MLTRIWILFVALALGAALAGVYLVASELDAEGAERARGLLSRDAAEIEAALALEAHRHVGETAPLAVDSEVRAALAAASKGEPFEGESLAAVLRSLDAELPGGPADRLIAVRADGRIVADLGAEEPAPEGAGVAAFPVVRDALRGYVGDDVIVYGGEILRVAARPVVEEGRYVGALVHGRGLDAALAARLVARVPDVTVAFIRGDEIIAADAPDDADEAIRPEALASAIASPSAVDRREIELGERGWASVAPITGSAAHAGVGVLVARPAPPASSPEQILSTLSRDDLRVVPWPIVGGAALLVLLVGWGLVSIDLRSARRRTPQVAEASPPAPPSEPIAPAPASPSELAAPAPAVPPSAPLAEAQAAPPPPQPAPAAEAPPPPPPEPEPEPAPEPEPEPEREEAPGIRTPAAPKPEHEAPPPAIPPAPAPPAAPAPPPFDPDGFDDDGATTVAEIPRELIAAVQDRESPPMDPETAHFHEVFEEFVAMKERLGEPTAGLTFERFEQTLKKNRDAIVAKHGVSTVRFTVYDKGGKAALRATPVK